MKSASSAEHENKIVELYDGSVVLEFDEDSHSYFVSVDGKEKKRVTGVTGAISVIAKPALLYWAVNMAIGSLEKRWKPGVAYDELQIKKMLEEAKGAHRQVAKDTADIGHLVHEWIERYIKVQKGTLTKEFLPPLVNEEAKRATDTFVRWVEENEVTFKESERKVYSKDFNYAGTLDFIAHIGKKDWDVLGDIKTSSGIYPEMLYQTAAYQQAYEEEHEDSDILGNIIVRCGKDGTLEIRESEEYVKNLDAFLGALKLYNRQQEIKGEELSKLV